MNIQLVWFRTDLRVRDNPALLNALLCGPSVAVYIATPQQWASHNDAPIKLDFWRRNLHQLKRKLDDLNIELISFQVADYNAIPALFNRLFNELRISGLHYNREYPLNEERRDKLVDKLCTELGVSVSGYDSEVLVAPASLLNQSGTPFKVFTPFAKKLRSKMVDESPLLIEPHTPPANSNRPEVKTLDYSCAIDHIDWPTALENWSRHWPAGEEASQSQLRKFAESKISAYKDKRDIPAKDGTSALSPYLCSGIISISDCWRMTEQMPDNDGIRCWQNELLWREFYKHIVFHFPQVCMHKPFKENTNNVPWQHNSADFDNWCQGKTGYPLVRWGHEAVTEQRLDAQSAENGDSHVSQ